MSYTDTTGLNLVTKNPIRYRGYYFDHETGFYYLKSRYYSPEICRFLSPDVLVDNRGVNTQNLFAYCANNAVNRIDINGNAWETIWDFVSLCFSIFDVCCNPKDFLSWIGLGFDAISLVTPFLPAMGASLKVIGVSDEMFDAGKTADKIIDTKKKGPNPFGRKGGIAHQTEIFRQTSKYPNALIRTEVKLDTPQGYKSYRFADFSVTENGYTWYGNVGKQTKKGLPCARERRALEDMRRAGFDVLFFPYN